MAKKWEMPTRPTLLSWLTQLKLKKNWKKLTDWEKEYINGWSMNTRDPAFIPSRLQVEKLEEIYATNT